MSFKDFLKERCIYLKSRVTKERQTELLLVHSLKQLQQQRPGQVKLSNQELHPVLPDGWQGSKD